MGSVREDRIQGSTSDDGCEPGGFGCSQGKTPQGRLTRDKASDHSLFCNSTNLACLLIPALGPFCFFFLRLTSQPRIGITNPRNLSTPPKEAKLNTMNLSIKLRRAPRTYFFFLPRIVRQPYLLDYDLGSSQHDHSGAGTHIRQLHKTTQNP